jgi:coenzyme F420-reducing hydrogenase delta subunit
MNNSNTIVVFVCNWDGLSCVETAAQKHLTFPAYVKIIRVSCLSRVHTGVLLKAFELNADGVMLLGCDSKSCHFGIEEELIDQNVMKAQEIMKLLGLDANRLTLARLPHGDGVGFIKRVNQFAEQFSSVEELK